MSFFLGCLMAATVALLTAAVCAVLWRPASGRQAAGASGSAQAAPRPTATLHAVPAQPEPPADAPPEGSLLAAQLEVGQTFHVQTRTAKYILTLRDPVVGQYDAVRVGPKLGKVQEERFPMFFKGTFVPDHGLRFREFTLGGNLFYDKIRDGAVLRVSPSSRIARTK